MYVYIYIYIYKVELDYQIQFDVIPITPFFGRVPTSCQEIQSAYSNFCWQGNIYKGHSINKGIFFFEKSKMKFFWINFPFFGIGLEQNYFNLAKYLFWGYSKWWQIRMLLAWKNCLSSNFWWQTMWNLQKSVWFIWRSSFNLNIFTNGLNMGLLLLTLLKRQFMKHTDSLVKKKFWAQQSVKKLMLTVFCVMNGPITIDFLLKKSATVKSDFHCQLLMQKSPSWLNGPGVCVCVYIYIYIYNR